MNGLFRIRHVDWHWCCGDDRIWSIVGKQLYCQSQSDGNFQPLVELCCWDCIVGYILLSCLASAVSWVIDFIEDDYMYIIGILVVLFGIRIWAKR